MTERRRQLMILLLIVATLVTLGALAVLPALMERRWKEERRRKGSPVDCLRTIATAQPIFREGDKEGDGKLDYGTLTELGQTRLVDEVLGSGTKAGYLFETAPSVTTSEWLWFAVASPEELDVDHSRYYCTNHAGVIFYTTVGPFALNTADCTIPASAVPVGR
jgi:hypothetical protein